MDLPQKRAFSDSSEPQFSKKRAVEGVNGSPQVNGRHLDVDGEEPSDADNLEAFRKEAVYRRMKHYRREHERSQERIAELERLKTTCDAGLAAMAACWSQLVETVQSSLKKSSDSDAVDAPVQDLLDLTKHLSEDSPRTLEKELRENLRVTEGLVTQLFHLKEKGRTLSTDDYINMSHRAHRECTVLRAEIAVMRVRLRDSETQKGEFYDQLVAAETRADRLQSKTVLAMQSRSGVEKSIAHEEVTEAKELQTPLPISPVHAQPDIHNGISPEHDSLDDWQSVARERELRIVELEKDILRLRDQSHPLQSEAAKLSQQEIAENPHYKVLFEHARKLEVKIGDISKEIAQYKEEADRLRNSRKEFEDAQIAITTQSSQEYKSLLLKKEAEVTRLRDQRDQQQAELLERKQQGSVKIASLQEFKGLAECRAERIEVLGSEVKRYRARLAADTGSEDLLAFIIQYDGNSSYIQNLADRLSSAEARASAVESSLSYFQDDQTGLSEHFKREAELRQELAETARQLERFTSVYGDPTFLPPEVGRLSELLQQKQAEIERLRLQETVQNHAQSALYTELDKLSVAWEALDRQMKNKVYDLRAMEERIEKIAVEKAKAENKFFGAMRERDALDNERKNMARTIEKQAKVIDRLTEANKEAEKLQNASQQAITSLTKAKDVLEAKTDQMENEEISWKARIDSHAKRSQELMEIIDERERFIEQKRSEVRRLEENLARSKKEVDKLMGSLKSMRSGPSSQKEQELQDEVDKWKSALKCSTCKLNMRDTVITKCMHTFCKKCVDARLATRQRKCPACNLAFAQSEVQPLYFQ